MRVKIKPLSVNQCWQGKKFKTPKYKAYERELMFKLKPLDIPKGKLKVYLVFGVSSKLADIDNPVKAFIDVLQKFYKFNDRDIYKMLVVKEDVKKGEEYVDFKIIEYKK
jgi:Holliday junction resolvase RusA-like endonuclease